VDRPPGESVCVKQQESKI